MLFLSMSSIWSTIADILNGPKNETCPKFQALRSPSISIQVWMLFDILAALVNHLICWRWFQTSEWKFRFVGQISPDTFILWTSSGHFQSFVSFGSITFDSDRQNRMTWEKFRLFVYQHQLFWKLQIQNVYSFWVFL